ncbi:MAG: putative sugar O-methyltransferase [Epsilonproteobacteria bacterium]|nr:putative sugar O-methyltransferase [Campylobacterota bacterium]
MRNLIYTLKWLIRRVILVKKEIKNLYQKLVYQPQSQFLLSADMPNICPLEPIKFYSFLGRVGFAFREFLALVSNGVIFKKQILLDGFDNIDVKKLYEIGRDTIPHPKPPLVEIEKNKSIDKSIFKTIEKSYTLANDNDPDRFDRASWWEEMSRAFKEELFDKDGNINHDYLINFRGIKELPANLVKDQFLIVNREFGYYISYLKAIDLVLEYHRHAQIVKKEILFSLSESYAGNNLCVNYRGVRLSLRLLFHSIMADNLLSNTRLSNRPVIWEIGAGYGGLARILKSYIPNSCHILLDLPETLTYCSYFIAYNFPNKKIAYLSDIIDRLDEFDRLIDEYDFIIIPPWISPYIPNSSVDLVIDTYSMSEMSKVYAKYYLKHIDRTLKVEGYFYSINKRFKREDDKYAFYEWQFESQFTTILYEYSKYLHPQWLGKKINKNKNL